MHEALIRGEDVVIRGFGRYTIETKPAYVKRSFNNREVIVPEQKAIKFTPSRKFNFNSSDTHLKIEDK